MVRAPAPAAFLFATLAGAVGFLLYLHGKPEAFSYTRDALILLTWFFVALVTFVLGMYLLARFLLWRSNKRLAALETPERLKLLEELEADLRRKYEARLAPIEQRLADPAPISASEEEQLIAEVKTIAKKPE